MLKPKSSKEFLASRFDQIWGLDSQIGKPTIHKFCGVSFVTSELPLQLHFFQELANVHIEMQVCLNFHDSGSFSSSKDSIPGQITILQVGKEYMHWTHIDKLFFFSP